jgi:exopolysaccharide biosynthesis polyprenyl glycosylphosphotransferase
LLSTTQKERSLAASANRQPDWSAGGTDWAAVGPVLLDIFFVFLSGFAAFCFRYGTDWIAYAVWGAAPDGQRFDMLNEHLVFLLLYAALIVLVSQAQGLYNTSIWTSPLDESLSVAKAVGVATLVLVACIYASKVQTVSRLLLGSSAVYNVAFLSAWRFYRRKAIERNVARGHGVRKVLIVGAGKVGQDLARFLQENKQLGLAVRGFLDEEREAEGRLLGGMEDFDRIIRTHFIDEVFITIPEEREVVKSVVLAARERHLNVKVVPDLYDGLAWRAPIEHVGEFPVMSLHREPIPVMGLLAKRLIDMTVSGMGLAVISPLLGLVALAIRLDSEGPVLYRSARIGKRGRRFVCYKFRTMVANADALKESLRHLNEREGPFFKIANDPRMTGVGRFLRKYSLDELPQLWNVFKGEMSLVGPRPHPVDDYEQYDLEHLRRLDVTPGITGIWQVNARSDPSFEKNMALDLEYIENWSPWLDIEILLRTIPVVFKGSGT